MIIAVGLYLVIQRVAFIVCDRFNAIDSRRVLTQEQEKFEGSTRPDARLITLPLSGVCELQRIESAVLLGARPARPDMASLLASVCANARPDAVRSVRQTQRDRRKPRAYRLNFVRLVAMVHSIAWRLPLRSRLKCYVGARRELASTQTLGAYAHVHFAAHRFRVAPVTVILSQTASTLLSCRKSLPWAGQFFPQVAELVAVAYVSDRVLAVHARIF